MFVIVRWKKNTAEWSATGKISPVLPGKGELWEGWEMFPPPEGVEVQEGDRLYPAGWWPEEGAQAPPQPAYVRNEGEWVPPGAYPAPWEMKVAMGDKCIWDGLPSKALSLRAVLGHIGWSNTPGWRDSVREALQDAKAIVVDQGDSVAVWVYRSLDPPQIVRPGECAPEVFGVLSTGAIPARNLRALRRTAVWEAARLCAAAAAPETARLVRTAYMPSVTEAPDDELASALVARVAQTAMSRLSALCADQWKTWRSVHLPDGPPEEWTVRDCGRAAVARVSSLAAARPQSRISESLGRQAAVTEVVAEDGDVAIVPSGIRTDRTAHLSAAVGHVTEKWGDAEVQRWWNAQGIAPWEASLQNGRVRNALEDPYDPNNPDRVETREMAEYLVRQMVRHLLDLLRVEEEIGS
jgi:hypothetical protein